MTHATATLDQMRPPVPAEPGLPIYNNKLGMWVFLASEVMFFTGLIGAYVILRFGAPGEWAKPNVVLNVPLTGINTFILICSSVSMVKAFAAISAGDRKGLSRWLLAIRDRSDSDGNVRRQTCRITSDLDAKASVRAIRTCRHGRRAASTRRVAARFKIWSGSGRAVRKLGLPRPTSFPVRRRQIRDEF